jgi:predicted HTH domain antitoxin
MAGKKWLSGRLPVWQTDRVCPRNSVVPKKKKRRRFKIMGAIYIEYPTNLVTAFNQSHEDFEQEAKLAMAAKLFELGKVTSGQAAKLAGISRVRFLLEFKIFQQICFNVH